MKWKPEREPHTAIATRMLMIEPPSAAVRFSAANFDSATRLLPRSATLFVSRNKYRRLTDNLVGRRCDGRVRNGNGIRAMTKEQSSSGPVKQNAKPQRYHPSEEIAESELMANEEARLTPAETTRTIIEVNSKATLMFSGFVSEEIHENIFWPDLPYVTDEYGNVYFQVKNDEDVLQALTSEETIVQVIIGLDTAEIISEMEALGHSEIDFDELDDDDSDFDDEEDNDEDSDDGEDDDNYEKDWVAILDNDEDQDEESDASLGDWAKLETMRSSHPMYFAKKLTEVVSDDPVDFMEQPSAGLAIQGLLRPAFLEEHSVIQKHISGHQSSNADVNKIAKEQKPGGIVQINGHKHEKEQAQDIPTWAEELEKDESLGNGISFYKLEMVKIQLVSAHGHQSFVEIEDFRRARPDAIAHSAAKIIFRLKAGGEKTTQALKSLCWRCMGIQVQEVALIGVDSLGFELRVCSGTQVQTLRFAFKKRASSEYSAERQLNDLLFPRSHKYQQKKETQQTES
ncbi:Pentatricopeptide repeat (PPR) superfamily protein [Abeliophyllum distichum]|uniref:Pentatricopeptide repeat (PPR) superfamily protein n=1 Tax=Abeliophyllum distichum TaxID=126358 RepID=A0ABD1VSA5_9LAMI